MRATLAILTAALLLAGCTITTDDAASAPASATATAETVVTAPGAADVVGMTLDAAQDVLSDFDVVPIDASGDDRMVIVAGNWTVTGQAQDGMTVTLEVLKTSELDAPDDTTTDASASDLGAAVDAALKAELGVDAYTEVSNSDWIPYIASIETLGHSTVAVTMQVTGESEEWGETIAMRILNLTGGAVPELEWVQVNDATGNPLGQVSRSESALLGG